MHNLINVLNSHDLINKKKKKNACPNGSVLSVRPLTWPRDGGSLISLADRIRCAGWSDWTCLQTWV